MRATACATKAGYEAHRRRAEPPCDPCREAAPDLAPEEADGPGESRPLRTAICPVCAQHFDTHVPNKVYCSLYCRYRQATPNGKKASASERKNPRNGRPWRRLRELVQQQEPLCWVCEDVIDSALQWPDPYSFSADHVVPLSIGGQLLDRTNVRASHLRCNRQRGGAHGNARRYAP